MTQLQGQYLQGSSSHNTMNNDSHLTPAVAILGLLGSITLEGVNTFVAIILGLVSLAYVSVKLWKEIKNGRK